MNIAYTIDIGLLEYGKSKQPDTRRNNHELHIVPRAENASKGSPRVC